VAGAPLTDALVGGDDRDRASGGAFVPRVRPDGPTPGAAPGALTQPTGRLHLTIERERPIRVRSGPGAGTRLTGLAADVDCVTPPLEGPLGARAQLLLGVAHDELEAHLGLTSGFAGELRSARTRPFLGAIAEHERWGGAWLVAEDRLALLRLLAFARPSAAREFAAALHASSDRRGAPRARAAEPFKREVARAGVAIDRATSGHRLFARGRRVRARWRTPPRLQLSGGRRVRRIDGSRAPGRRWPGGGLAASSAGLWAMPGGGDARWLGACGALGLEDR
jgi:hypothetical protein